jgi:hypothetical protein
LLCYVLLCVAKRVFGLAKSVLGHLWSDSVKACLGLPKRRFTSCVWTFVSWLCLDMVLAKCMLGVGEELRPSVLRCYLCVCRVVGCPSHGSCEAWLQIGRLCVAPVDYDGTCSPAMDFSSYSLEETLLVASVLAFSWMLVLLRDPALQSLVCHQCLGHLRSSPLPFE